MRISWTKTPALVLIAVAVFAGPGCGSSDSKTPASTCGNGKLDDGEVCDGTDIGTATCSTATMGMATVGKPKCSSDCKLVTEGNCTKASGSGGAPTMGSGGAPMGAGGAPKPTKDGGAMDSGAMDSGAMDSGAGGTTAMDSGVKDSGSTPVMDASKKDSAAP